MDVTELFDFYKGKRVFISGHTGFKGSWLSTILVNAGAKVIGFSSGSKEGQLRLFDLCKIGDEIVHLKGNIQHLQSLLDAFQLYQPEIVFHLAAQPIVRESYRNPVETYMTNVMGTVNSLEAVRQSPSVRSVLNVTTDKVYENREWCWGYRENEPLDGYDPYSNSKSCSELVTHSYIRSFFQCSTLDSSASDKHSVDTAVSTARAGNVIGGGDFAIDRIIPDCVRAASKGESIVIRNPHSIRPYQHVLEPLFAYLSIAARQYEDSSVSGYYNVGPDEADCVETSSLVDLFCKYWNDNNQDNRNDENNKNLTWTAQMDVGPHEANFLKLDCSKIKAVFGWRPRWNIETAVEKTIEWTKVWLSNRSDSNKVRACMNKQIEEFLGGEHL